MFWFRPVENKHDCRAPICEHIIGRLCSCLLVCPSVCMESSDPSGYPLHTMFEYRQNSTQHSSSISLKDCVSKISNVSSLENFIPAQHAGESEAGEAAVVHQVAVGTLEGVSEGVAPHAHLAVYHHHVEHCVPVGVLGVGVGPLGQQQVVHALVTQTGGPREGVLPQVGQALGR